MAKQEAEQQPRSVSPLNFGAAFRAFGQGAVATLEAQRAAVQAERPPSLLRTHAQAFASGVAADLDAKEREWKAQQPIGTARTAGRMVAGASKAYALRGLNHVLGTPDRWATNRAERKAIDKAEGLNKRVQAHKDDLENQAQEAGIGRAQRANQFTQDMQDFVQEREESRQARATYGAHQQADWASQQDSQRAGNQTRYGLHFAETGGGDYYSDTREGQQVRAQAEDYMNQRMNSTQSGPLIIEGEVAE